jgi:septum formation protein
MIQTTPELILASCSPRRRSLLQLAGLRFAVIPAAVDEASVRLTSPTEFVQTLALAKAEAVARQYPLSWVIGADTIVVIDGVILGKPASDPIARQMLARLNGRPHFVYTGYAIVCQHQQVQLADTVKTEVQFKHLSDDEIDWYIQTGEPVDKAGAYAIQGLGSLLIRRINGSYTNVVGLPVCEVIESLIGLGVVSLKAKKTEGLTV